MLSAVIASRHSYPAMPLAGQPVDQRSVHPGPLVASVPCFQERRLYLHPFPPPYGIRDEDDGILPIGAVIFSETIPQPMSPRIFQRKSLRGQSMCWKMVGLGAPAGNSQSPGQDHLGFCARNPKSAKCSAPIPRIIVDVPTPPVL